jgi:hypothetical protein
MMWIHDTREVNKQIISTIEVMSSGKIREMKAYRALLRVPPYPDCELEDSVKYLVYHYKDGTFRTVTGLVKYEPETKRYYIDFHAFGFESPQVRVRYVSEKGGTPVDLPGTCSGSHFYYTRPELPKVIAVFEVREPGKEPVLFGGPML